MSGGDGPALTERSSVYLKPRGSEAPVAFETPSREGALAIGPQTPIEAAEYVAIDVETTGTTPFLVIEIGAERFTLARPLSLFDTLVQARARINSYARRRHQINRDMLAGAPEFSEARAAFLHFARGAVLVEHSHDAFDSYLIGRGLRRPLPHPVIDTSTLARLVLDLPAGQTPGLARVVEALGIKASPEHAALGDAQATAAVFRELAPRAAARFGWGTVGEMAAALVRPEIDRSALEGRRPGVAGRRSRTGAGKPAGIAGLGPDPPE